MSLMQRSREAAQFQEWERQENQFHLEQARLRSCIRIQDGRAKPIDLLAKYVSVSVEGGVDAVEMHEPYTYLSGLTIKDLEDLIEDIKVYRELERGNNAAYWEDITIVVEEELRTLHKLEFAAVGRHEGIHPSVAKEVASVFKEKTAAQLEAMQLQIKMKISGKPDGVDIGYWESLLSQLKAHMARVRLRDRHKDNLRHKLEMLKAQQGVAATGSEEETGDGAETIVKAQPDSEEKRDEVADGNEAANTMLSESFAAYESGGYSPQYLSLSQLDPDTLMMNEEDDLQRLVFARMQVQGTGSHVKGVMATEEQALQREARIDKYRPRKPRYFNRVRTGYEWNKYNQTHYDMDNPPPKFVQGYKFNIFYPDLIDKNTVPQYSLTPCTDNRDFANLRFHAGPPYEDIAFKIVNREWKRSCKEGFRCQFDNNIFQLWFNFKRCPYRR
jgi:hypothetical protein